MLEKQSRPAEEHLIGKITPLLPLLALFLSLSYWYSGILYCGLSLFLFTFQPIASLSSPALTLHLPPSLQWQGLYGFSDKRDLLLLLFFLFNLLSFSSFCLIPSFHTHLFLILFPLFPLFLHYPSLHPHSSLSLYLVTFPNHLYRSTPISSLHHFHCIFPTSSSFSSTEIDGQLSCFISVFLQLSEAQFGGEMSRTRSRWASAFSWK